MSVKLQAQIREYITPASCGDREVYNRYLTRLGRGVLTRDEDQESHVGTFFLPYNPRAQEFFLVHHKKAGSWIAPGGHVDTGESIMDALRREVKEETGFDGEIHFIQFPLGKKDKTQFMFYNFIGIVDEEFKPNPSKQWAWETQKWEWFKPDKLPTPLLTPMKNDIERVKPFIDIILKLYSKGKPINVKF